MLGDVWRWAGKFRRSERNLGIAFYEIPMALRQLLDDVHAWIEFNTYTADEIAVRFHHRLVQIHPFPNGSGRHARLMSDLLIMSMGRERFSWGRRACATRARCDRLISPRSELRTTTTSDLFWRSHGPEISKPPSVAFELINHEQWQSKESKEVSVRNSRRYAVFRTG